MKQEEDAQQRMTSILKKMHSPSNFAAPEILLPGQARSSPFKSVMAHQTRDLTFATSPKAVNTAAKNSVSGNEATLASSNAAASHKHNRSSIV